MKLNSLALAAALVVSSASSLAATPITLTQLSPTHYAGSFSGAATENTFTLDLSALPPVTDLHSGLTANLFGTGYDITGATFDGVSFTPLVNVSLPPVFSFDTWIYTSASPVTASIHTLVIYGNSIGGQGFTGNVSLFTAPVPEPETYAMLLAGLGVMGAIARRRNKAV